MKSTSHLLSLLTLLPSSHALSIPTKRQTDSLVKDGSFEHIHVKWHYLPQLNTRMGDWTVNGSAYFDANVPSDPTTVCHD